MGAGSFYGWSEYRFRSFSFSISSAISPKSPITRR